MFLLEDLSLPKILFILVVVLLLFGPGKLPEIGASLGKAIKNFKQGIRSEEARIPASLEKGR